MNTEVVCLENYESAKTYNGKDYKYTKSKQWNIDNINHDIMKESA